MEVDDGNEMMEVDGTSKMFMQENRSVIFVLWSSSISFQSHLTQFNGKDRVKIKWAKVFSLIENFQTEKRVCWNFGNVFLKEETFSWPHDT